MMRSSESIKHAVTPSPNAKTENLIVKLLNMKTPANRNAQGRQTLCLPFCFDVAASIPLFCYKLSTQNDPSEAGKMKTKLRKIIP